MHTGTKTLIISLVSAITIICCVFGCGKRTTTYEKHYIKSDSLNIQNSTELRQNATWSDIGTVKPFDPLKPMLWNGAWHYNTVIEFDKSIKKGIDIKINGKYVHTNSEDLINKRDTERTDNANLYIGLSFVIGLLFILYLTLKKYKIL